jgi:dTDP-D-glucose 4,6-dehydratase
MKTILVTGGCGFIGGNFVRLLASATDYRIVNFDKLTYAGNLENVADINPARMRVEAIFATASWSNGSCRRETLRW